MLKINLLPAEFLAVEKEYQKFKKIQLVCIALVLVLAFLSSATVALRVLQSQKVATAQEQLDQLTNKVTGYKNKEAQLLILKSRITALQSLSEVPSKQKSLYNLILQLIPREVVVSGVSIDNAGNLAISLLVPESISLENLLNNLTSKEKNEGKIKEIQVDNLTRTRDGVFRTNLSLKPN